MGVEMLVLTDDQKQQLAQLQQSRKQTMIDLSKTSNSDELNKQFLLGQMRDIQDEIRAIINPK